MGKKKFIDKKKSATFQLLARDSSDPSFLADSPGADRVFVRVDNNPVPAAAFISAEAVGRNGDPYTADHNSVFDDVPGDDDDGVDDRSFGGSTSSAPRWSRGGGSDDQVAAPLPEEVRREILELGFPDDGYNYLIHLREIKNTGGGSAFYHNPKFRVEHIPRDVKAYDASRLQISEVNGEPEQNLIYSVASKTNTLRVQKVVDPEVAALLDDSDLSRFGSDVEDLEEDFVVRANLHEDEDEEEKALICDSKNSAEKSMTNRNQNNKQVLQVSAHSRVTDNLGPLDVTNDVIGADCADEKPRARRLLDEQFDLLERQEYGTDDDDDDGDYYDNFRAEEDESLTEKLKLSLNNHMMDDLELNDGKYRNPADSLKKKEAPKIEEEEDCAADVIRRCKEYAEGYEVEDGEGDKDVVLVQESIDESEVWDCETIVSTYSNFENHPGKIGAPEVTRKKKLAETVSAALSSSSQIISLRGKGKIPVDFLPSKEPAAEKVKGLNTGRTEQYKRKPHGLESKEEKKERKAAVKEERREARRMKKEMRGLYRCEAHRAQRVAAISGPSSIHLL